MQYSKQFLLYKQYHIDKEYTSIGLFRELNNTYNIEKAFYPGSHVHITSSLIFPYVVYADSFRNTYKFFEDPYTLKYIDENKEYEEESFVKYYQQDYNEPFKELKQEFDLVISQYAGFVGQAVKKYLKKDGFLLCNNSHGDASMSFIDPDYELVAVYRRKTDEKFSISTKDLYKYFVPKKGIHPCKEEILESMKGVAYIKSPSGYIFRKISKM